VSQKVQKLCLLELTWFGWVAYMAVINEGGSPLASGEFASAKGLNSLDCGS
jgi:hypothetical protein